MRIERASYINKLVDRKGNGMVKIITGVRRCGKSFLLFELYYEYLLSIGVKEDQVIKVSLDTDSFVRERNPEELAKYIKERIDDKKEYYVFIDEIQYCKKIPNKL